MPINFQIEDDYFNEEEIQKLSRIFDIDRNGDNFTQQFNEKIHQMIFVSLNEYKEMFLGSGMPSRADELKEYRLYQLILNYFVDRIPSETEIALMFQMTTPRSRNLIRNVISKYRFSVERILYSTLYNLLNFEVNNREFEDDNNKNETELTIQSDFFVEEIKKIIDQVAPNLDQINKVPLARRFKVSRDSFYKLEGFLRDRR